MNSEYQTPNQDPHTCLTERNICAQSNENHLKGLGDM